MASVPYSCQYSSAASHRLCWWQAQASYDLPLAQFMAEALPAAEETGAAAIMPYKLIPYPYPYDSAFYEFGTDSDAYTYAVSAMVQHQAQRVRPSDAACHGRSCASAHHGGRLLRLLTGRTSFSDLPSASSPSTRLILSPPSWTLRQRCSVHISMLAALTIDEQLGELPCALLGNSHINTHACLLLPHCLSSVSAQTTACASGKCPKLAPPCQCFDMPLQGSSLSCTQLVSACAGTKCAALTAHSPQSLVWASRAGAAACCASWTCGLAMGTGVHVTGRCAQTPKHTCRPAGSLLRKWDARALVMRACACH